MGWDEGVWKDVFQFELSSKRRFRPQTQNFTTTVIRIFANFAYWGICQAFFRFFSKGRCQHLTNNFDMGCWMVNKAPLIGFGSIYLGTWLSFLGSINKIIVCYAAEQRLAQVWHNEEKNDKGRRKIDITGSRTQWFWLFFHVTSWQNTVKKNSFTRKLWKVCCRLFLLNKQQNRRKFNLPWCTPISNSKLQSQFWIIFG